MSDSHTNPAPSQDQVLINYLEAHLTREHPNQEIPEAGVRNLISLRNEVTEFERLMMYYECAMSEVQTKLEVLNKELTHVNKRNPFESIKGRIKSPSSIYDKMYRRGWDFSVSNIEKNLNDVAGIRVICSFIDDIYMLRDCLIKQDDVFLIAEKDYIKNPKDNGYRSLHLILEIPIFLTNEKRMMRVEVQFRTIAMDFWASLEHQMKYKKDVPNSEAISEELLYSADLINQLDRRMIQIRDKINAPEK
ncbi:MAG: GTP pyrophosphokinase family protein [Lachnospiraceae bacterium]|nr:GTP pyrophosphokinase family protein [Lachnospiraceae bacterium]